MYLPWPKSYSIHPDINLLSNLLEVLSEYLSKIFNINMKLKMLQDLNKHVLSPQFTSKLIPLSGINLNNLGISQGQDQDSVRGGSNKKRYFSMYHY